MLHLPGARRDDCDRVPPTPRCKPCNRSARTQCSTRTSDLVRDGERAGLTLPVQPLARQYHRNRCDSGLIGDIDDQASSGGGAGAQSWGGCVGSGRQWRGRTRRARRWRRCRRLCGRSVRCRERPDRRADVRRAQGTVAVRVNGRRPTGKYGCGHDVGADYESTIGPDHETRPGQRNQREYQRWNGEHAGVICLSSGRFDYCPQVRQTATENIDAGRSPGITCRIPANWAHRCNGR